MDRKFVIKTSINRETGVIEQRMYAAAMEIERAICNTKDKSVRAALVALGWKPPKEKKK